MGIGRRQSLRRSLRHGDLRRQIAYLSNRPLDQIELVFPRHLFEIAGRLREGVEARGTAGSLDPMRHRGDLRQLAIFPGALQLLELRLQSMRKLDRDFPEIRIVHRKARLKPARLRFVR